MTVPCKKCPLRLRAAFTSLSTDELNFMERFKMGELQVEAGAPVMLEGSKSPHFHTVLSGVGIREKALRDGRRQVVNFIFPGDLIGLQAGMLGEMKHGVEAATDMTLCVFSRERLWDLYKQHPARAYDVTWLAATEEHALGQALLSVGRRTAREKIAHLFAILMRRGVESGFASSETEMRFPWRQQDLADAAGISLVHANKMIQSLRKDGVVRLDDGALDILDADALREAAMMDDEPAGEDRPLL